MKKIIGIFVGLLVIATALPTVGGMIKPITRENKQLDTILPLEFVPGELIVKFTKKTAITHPSIDTLNQKYHVNSMEKMFRNTEDTILDNIYLLHVSEDADIVGIVQDYATCSDVEYAEPNGLVYPCGTPNDENFSKQWHLHNTGQTGGTPDCDIDAPEAWEEALGSSDVVIAIVDSGVDYTHPDLADNIWINLDEIPDNGIDDDNNGYIDDIHGWDFTYNDMNHLPLDTYGHGTHCAGIAGAVTNNEIGIAGVCWNCKLMPVTIFSWTASRWSWAASGIKYAADNGANVISMSFGWYQFSRLIKDAVDYAYEKGAVLVAAAGNDGVGIIYKMYPAAYMNVIAVGATDNNDSRMEFTSDNRSWSSNFGLWVDVAAPGEFIYSTTPTYPTNWTDYGLKPYYDVVSGTSMACPIVAGVAGLLLSKNTSLSQNDVKSIICKSVDPYHSEYYLGTGRINAYNAMQKPKNKDSDDAEHQWTPLVTILVHDKAYNPLLFTFVEKFTEYFPLLTRS